MDRARDQLLAGARLAIDRHRRLGGRDAIDHGEDLAHALRSADEIAVALRGLVAEVGVLVGQAATLALRGAQLEGALHLEAHHLGLERLDEKVEGAELHRLDRGLHGAEGGDDHRRAVGILLFDLGEHVDAGEPVHLEVADDEVGRRFDEALQTFGPRRGTDGRVPHLADDVRDAVADGLVVVDDEDGRHVARAHPTLTWRQRLGQRDGAPTARRLKPSEGVQAAPEPSPTATRATTRSPAAALTGAGSVAQAGSRSVNVVPALVLSTSTRPPWSTAISRTKASPRPVPFCFVV